MKRLMVALATTAIVACTAGAADAQQWTSINERQRLLDDRIDAGVHSGQLTSAEATRLRAEFRGIAALEHNYRRHGLSASERRDLDRRFDALTSHIRYERHDAQSTDGWFGGAGWMDRAGRWTPVNARQRELDRRIDIGVRNGRLNRAEALRLRREYRRIARLEARYRRGGLTLAERSDLDRRFDQLATHIRFEASDSQLGYGYGYGVRR